MELRLLVAAAGILVGLAIQLAGVRLLGVGDSRASVRRSLRSSGDRQAFVSGALLMVSGVLLVILGGWAIGQAHHEMMTMVKPNSTLRLDIPADAGQDRSPDPRDRDR